MPRRPLIVAASLSLLILLAKLAFPVPALSDPTGAALPAGVHLAFPVLNLLLAPLFDLWDGVTLLAMPRLQAFLAGAAALFVLGRVWLRNAGWRRHAVAVVEFLFLFGAFLVGGAGWRRPMAHIAGVPDTLLVVDLHSHTNLSHDVTGWLQRDFDLETSRAWHRRGGFEAFFVTEHNRPGPTGVGALPGDPVACPGEELSLWGAHIVELGSSDSIPRALYADSAPGIARFLHESESRWGGVTLASIPEYDENHFADLATWIHDGVDGFEISNAAPKANRQTVAHRDAVIALARANGRWLAGVSDQHGLGATVQAWNLVPKMTVPIGYRPVPSRCRGILEVLMTRGSAATQVIERHRLRIDSPWPTFATIVAVPWEGWRAAGMWQLVSWLGWIWGITLIRNRRKPDGDPSAAEAASG